MDVAAPIRKASVEKAPLYSPGARSTPEASLVHVEENPSSDESRTKMIPEKRIMKIETYLYSVKRNELAPSRIASWSSAAFSSICYTEFHGAVRYGTE